MPAIRFAFVAATCVGLLAGTGAVARQDVRNKIFSADCPDHNGQ